MTSSTDGIIVDQTLHGYMDGHRLLAASCELPSSARRLIQVLSDLSGSTIEPGFETYITGYPLTEIGKYALARTWYAPEMNRPGCVWTHTILISFIDLNRIKSSTQFAKVFSRPVGFNDQYSVEMVLPLAESNVTDDANYQTDLSLSERSIRLIRGTYSEPLSPFVYVTTPGKSLEVLLLELWGQQWASLKSRFSFCSGSLAPRLLNNQPFDLQITSRSSARLFTRHASLYKVDREYPTVSDTETQYRWVQVASQDLSNPGINGLRPFLSQYGVDVPHDRKTFSPLVATYDEVEEMKIDFNQAPSLANIMPLVNNIGQRFPVKGEAKLLKDSVFGYPSVLSSCQSPELESSILGALATTSDSDAFDSQTLGLRSRALQLSSYSAASSIELLSTLMQEHVSSLSADVIDGLLLGFTEVSFNAFVNQNPKILPLFISKYPALAYASSTWRFEVEDQKMILDALKRLPSVNWGAVTKAIIQSKADEVAQEVVDQSRLECISSALSTFFRSPNDRGVPSPTWLRILSGYSEDICSWITDQSAVLPHVTAKLLRLLNPSAPEVKSLPASIWFSLADILTELNADDRNFAASFLLALAFSTNTARCSAIVVKTFQPVHDAERYSRLPIDAWKWLDPLVPVLPPDRWWDRCERLRQRLVLLTIDGELSLGEFVTSVPDEYTFQHILDYCKASNRKGFLREVREYLSTTPTAGYPYQREILIKKGWWRRLLGDGI